MGKNRKRKTASSNSKAVGIDDESKGNKIESSSSFNENPLYREQQSFLSSLTTRERDFYFSSLSSDAITPDRRAELWMKQADIGEELVNKYAWATPTVECLKIFREFSPIVEIGSGSNAYWANYMIQTAGVDIVAYDINLRGGGKILPDGIVGAQELKRKTEKSKGSLVLRKGGPEVLKLPELRNHTLFLCYPDEEDSPVSDDESSNSQEANRQPLSFGWQCLSEYQGDYVIHVGELAVLGDATLNMEQSPWGRSSSPEFQQRLASEFHCIAKIDLPNWLHVRDSISVWKRSEICQMTFVGDENEEQEDEEMIEYRHIPPEEMLPRNIIAPCMAHLLKPSSLPKETAKNLKLSTMNGIGKKNPKTKNENEKTTESRSIPSKGKYTSSMRSETEILGPKTDSDREIKIGLQSKTKRGLRRERQKQKS